MDCFAEHVIGPRIARTRWLAMTTGGRLGAPLLPKFPNLVLPDRPRLVVIAPSHDE